MADKEFLDHILRTLEKISDRITEIEKVESAHLEILKDHTRRSLANEEGLLLLRKNVEVQLEPIVKHVSQVETVLKVLGLILGGLGGFVAIFLGIVELIKQFG